MGMAREIPAIYGNGNKKQSRLTEDGGVPRLNSGNTYLIQPLQHLFSTNWYN
jgi:hypothetical protein